MLLLLGGRDDHCPGGQGAGEGAGPFSASSKTSDLGALGTTDSCPAGEEDDKICAKLQNSAHLGSVGIFQGPPRGETQTPPCPAASPGLYLFNVRIPCFPPRDKGRRRNALESAVPPLASIRCGPRNCITFQNLLSALETRMEPSKCSRPRKSLV